MADLANPKWIYAKGVLFLLAGAAASALVIIECPTVKTAYSHSSYRVRRCGFGWSWIRTIA